MEATDVKGLFNELKKRMDGQIDHVRRELGGVRLLRPPPRPEQEVRLRGRRHSRARDQQAIAHHYDVSNRFYGWILGPSMTYTCAVYPTAGATLEQAQFAKHDLVARKLALRPGMRLLDVGCGWGGMVLHAARRYGVRAVGVTISERQAELAGKRVVDSGLSDLVEIRLQDYRDIHDGPYDAISSIGMFEHVGEARLAEYFGGLYRLLRPGGRLLNHGISRPHGERSIASSSQIFCCSFRPARSWAPSPPRPTGSRRR